MIRPLLLTPEQAPLVGKEYSEATAAKLDEEIKSLLEERESRVRNLLTSRRDLLENVAKRLLETEVVEEEFNRMLTQG